MAEAVNLRLTASGQLASGQAVAAQNPATQTVPGAVASVIRIELDERCFLFPDGKMLTHLMIIREKGDVFSFEAVFPFNATRLPSRFLSLSREEARLFAKEMIEVVYAARSGLMLHDGLKISIIVAPNGYRVEYQRAEMRVETFFSTGVIWRVIKGLLQSVDDASPIVSH
jgi:hypothetical protein